MQAAQPLPHPTTISSAIVRWLLISLVAGAAFACDASLLLISEYRQGALIGSFGFWPLILALTSSNPRTYLKHPNWKLALPLLLAYLLIVAGFIWYLPLAMNLLGPFLAVLTVAAIAQRVKPTSGVGWLMLLSCGLTAGAGAALVCWLMLSSGMDTLPITLALVFSAGLAGPVGKALGIASAAFWSRRNSSRGRVQDTPELVSIADSPGLSRGTYSLGWVGWLVWPQQALGSPGWHAPFWHMSFRWSPAKASARSSACPGRLMAHASSQPQANGSGVAGSLSGRRPAGKHASRTRMPSIRASILSKQWPGRPMELASR